MSENHNPIDKTLKLRAYDEAPKRVVTAESRAGEQQLSHELAKKTAQYEEEKSKNLELLKTIVQLRESLKEEQAKTAKLESSLKKLDTLEENQLVRKNSQLEEEKRKSLEQAQTIEQLRKTLDSERAKTTSAESRLKELTNALDKIVQIAAAGKTSGAQ